MNKEEESRKKLNEKECRGEGCIIIDGREGR